MKFFLEKSQYLLPVGCNNYYDYKNKYRNYKYHFIIYFLGISLI